LEDQHWMDLAEEAGQLREAMQTRAPIEQAKGMIALLRGCSVTDAYAELRRTSNDHNVKLHELATALVALVDGAAADDDPGLATAMRVAAATWPTAGGEPGERAAASPLGGGAAPS
jgi:hypothetical protein